MALSSEALSSASPRLEEITDEDPYIAARSLAALGIPVFPVHSVDASGRCSCGRDNCRDAGKHPRTSNGLLDATRDADRIRRWWTNWPDANVAVATGSAADVWVLDVDPGKGGLESLAQLEAEHGELQPTWCVETGGDGFHLWFHWGDVALRSSTGRLGPGLDVRAEGGYVIVPPSHHRSGNDYCWTSGWHPAAVELASAPQWLINLAHHASNTKLIPPDRAPIEGGVGRNQWPQAKTVIPEGERNETLTSLAGAMRHKGFGEAAIYAALSAENAQRCDPPLPEAEIARIAQSVSRYPPAAPVGARRRSASAKTYVEFIGRKAVAL